mmetsp:Transcript_2642/g.8261  ORF Transcript_2642/g.8261 Transcript_2642/m.8261 type:complete len:212 (-) Transcript_2642:584-1219(-)
MSTTCGRATASRRSAAVRGGASSGRSSSRATSFTSAPTRHSRPHPSTSLSSIVTRSPSGSSITPSTRSTARRDSVLMYIYIAQSPGPLVARAGRAMTAGGPLPHGVAWKRAQATCHHGVLCAPARRRRGGGPGRTGRRGRRRRRGRSSREPGGGGWRESGGRGSRRGRARSGRGGLGRERETCRANRAGRVSQRRCSRRSAWGRLWGRGRL